MKIIVTGGKGKFASLLKEKGSELGHEILCPTKEEMDIRKLWGHGGVYDYLWSQTDTVIVIHAGALTRPMVVHQERPHDSIETNIIGSSNVVLGCMKFDMKVIYVSTDYVYEGKDGNYTEDSPVKPFNNYGWSKLGGETPCMIYDNSLILRICMNNKPFPHPKALDDMYKSLIWDDEAADITLKLLDEKGIINVGGEARSVYDFVSKTHKEDIGRISLSDVSNVKMGTNTTMDCSKLERILND